ncbi:MAG: ABC transporter permease [Rhizobiales bacterium]|nr:ABC transporter permease [Hyphomicrobiales bacterium]
MRLEKRPERSAAMALASPFIALALTIVTAAIIFALRGNNPLAALYVYFIEPLTALWSVEQLLVKASPLILIGAGLSVCYRANVWNIGAEGQLTAGAILAGAVPVFFPAWQSPLVLLVMVALGVLGGMMWAAIPAFLRNRFSANEILTSLMLVYVVQLLLDYLVRGPWRDPQGFNFPKSVTFEGWQLLPYLTSGIHLGVLIAFIVALVLGYVVSRTLKGYEITVTGLSTRAARFSGFSEKRTVMFCMLLSGGLAGLAGAFEISSVVGQLQPQISPGYGFAAIIVAFLGRLNPVGVIFAGLLLALSYIGGEAVQTALQIPDKITRVIQGILLFYILACDTLITYRIVSPASRAAAAAGA